MEQTKLFYMSELFSSFERGKIHSADMLPEGNSHFYVGAKKKDNGVMKSCGYNKDLISRGNCIVFICNGEGSVGYCNYMDRDFYASGDLILGYGDFLNKYTALYVATLLDLERPKYSFGRKYGKYVKNTTIPLPVNNVMEPDWTVVENYVKGIIIPHLPEKARHIWTGCFNRQPEIKKNINLKDRVWEWFEFGSIIEKPTKGVAYNHNTLTECSSDFEKSIRYITRTDNNNGCKCFVINEDFIGVENENAITIGDTTASIFYQEKPFLCGDHIVVIRARWLNKYTGAFITTLLCREKYRYNYGRSLKIEKINTTRIKLPIIPDEEGKNRPDWQFMEDYIKSLPYSANI